jgi:signal peptidase I
MTLPDPEQKSSSDTRPSSPFDAFEKKKRGASSMPAGQKLSFIQQVKQTIYFLLFPAKVRGAEVKKEKSEFFKTVIVAFLIAIFIRSFLFQPFSIPSESMVPSLLVGDYLFVNKFAYGFSRYSLPFGLPLFSGRIFGTQPKRGDVIVFRVPKDGDKDYIKRVIGLPGDRVRMMNGQLYINSEIVPRAYVQAYQGSTDIPYTVGAPIYREMLSNGKNYLTIDAIKGTDYDDTPDYIVPEDHYFMMGDNRDNSQDSRYLNGPVGFVPFENIIGKAEVVFFSMNTQQKGGTEGKGSYFRFDRLLHWIN